MNERFEKLSQLAWTKTSEAVPFYDSTGSISRDFNLKYQQEFAELIVRECVGICDKRYVDIGQDGDGWLLARQIAEHFGVEE
jgi:hypothetical protein